MTPEPGEVTRLLQAWRRGEGAAEAELMAVVYDELRRVAGRALAAERADHTLQPTAVVHEVYLRLIDQRHVDWHDRAHFFAIAARMIRRVLIDHARRRGYQKRGAGAVTLRLDEGREVVIERPAELVAIDDALRALAARDELKAAIVELRFFGGLTGEEIATALGISVDQANRHWRAARAWLYAELRAAPDPGG